MFENYTEEKDCVTLLTSKEKLRGTFRMKTNTAVANYVRQCMLIDTPSIGFKTEPSTESDIKITTNTTPIPKEMLEHRVGMLPIAGDPATFDCSKYIFRLEVENKSDSVMNVRASDIIVIEKDSSNATEGTRVATVQFFPPDPITGDTSLITRLRPQWNPSNPPESIIFTGTASIATGTTNIRYSPVSQCSYENTLDTNPERQKEMFERWVKENKKMEEDADAGLMATLRREYDTMEVKRCFLVNELGEPNDFTFTIESKGIQSVRAIMYAGIMAGKARVAKYRDIDTMIPTNVTFRRGNTRYSSIECVFQHESHKLGNILQTYLTYNHIEGSKEPQISYAGYRVPHPLRPEMVLTIAIAASETSDLEIEIGIARYAVAQVCRYLVDFFQSMADQWSATTGYVPPTPIETPKAVVEPVEAPKAVEAPKPAEAIPVEASVPVETPKPVEAAPVEAPKPAEVAPVEAPTSTEASTAAKVKRTKKITSVAK